MQDRRDLFTISKYGGKLSGYATSFSHQKARDNPSIESSGIYQIPNSSKITIGDLHVKTLLIVLSGQVDNILRRNYKNLFLGWPSITTQVVNREQNRIHT